VSGSYRLACRRLLAVGSLTLVALVVLVAGAAPSQGQTVGEQVVSFDAELTVDQSGIVSVKETIVYDFGANQRHGIFRDVPTRFRYDDEHDRVTPITVRSVSTPGTNAPDQYSVESIEGGTRIRIGDPDLLVGGRITYVVDYEIEGALNGFEDHDELFWNVTGDRWQVPIGSASATVTTPAPITAVACFAGPPESSLPCGEATGSGRLATFRQDGLGPGSGLTVVVGFEPGVVTSTEPILEERWSLDRAFSRTPWTIGLMAALAAAVLFLVTRIVWSFGRDRRAVGSAVDVAFGTTTAGTETVPLGGGEPVPVEFVPPDGIRPGEMGTLIDESADPLDVTATIVDLAVRGYLRIEETEPGGWLRKPDWQLVRLQKSDDELLAYEKRLLDGLFEDGDTVTVSGLRRKFAARMQKVQTALYERAADQGWFRGRPDYVRLLWRIIGIAVTAVGIGLVVAAAVFTEWALVPVPLALGGLLLLAAARWMPARTAKGTGLVRRVLGFRRFIDESEAHRARFAEEQHLFTEYLPYAVVFGATEKWAKAFQGLAAVEAAPSWYVGSHAFAYGSFAASIGSFSVSSAGNLAAAASTASGGGSGFSGGGSGGGFGGGGGGSW